MDMNQGIARRKKMSQVLDNNGEWPNTASVPSRPLSRKKSLPLSRKRSRDNAVSSNDAHLRNRNGRGNMTAAGSAELIVELELADEMEVVSPHKKRRGVARSQRSGKNDAAGKCAHMMKDKDVDSGDKQAADHRQSPREGNAAAAAASHPMNSDSRQTSRDDGYVSTSKPPSNASGQQWRAAAWEDRLGELAGYRKEHGHCNVPYNYSENTKLAKWVTNQRRNYRLFREEKRSSMTALHIQELESLGFVWGVAWEDRLSELADYRKIHGHCNVPRGNNKNTKLAMWVGTQRSSYKLHVEGKKSQMTTFRIQQLESLHFDWGFCVTAWEDRLGALADYRKIHGHCNVPHNYKEDSNLGKWVTNQRSQYRLHAKGKTSQMTTVRIQELESLGFEWGDGYGATATWAQRLSELADYRKIHGHCNVPANYGENSKLANWVTNQRKSYKLRAKEKASFIATARIQELESMGFEWEVIDTAWEDRLSELADYRKIHGHCNVPRKYGENTKLATWVANQRRSYSLQAKGKTSYMTTVRIQELESLGFDWRVCVAAWEDRLSELADYRKIQGHCNVPANCGENTKLAKWVANQRCQYRFHLKGKTSSMTLPRIHALESLSFEWQPSIGQGKGTPKKPSSNDASMRVRERAVEPPKHMLHKSRVSMKTISVETSAAIKSISLSNQKNATGMASLYSKRQAAVADFTKQVINEEDLTAGEWPNTASVPSRRLSRKRTLPLSRKRPRDNAASSNDTVKKPSLQDYARRARERAVEAAELVQTTSQTQEDVRAREICSNEVDVASEPATSQTQEDVRAREICSNEVDVASEPE
jgi:hypothetical protein